MYTPILEFDFKKHATRTSLHPGSDLRYNCDNAAKCPFGHTMEGRKPSFANKHWYKDVPRNSPMYFQFRGIGNAAKCTLLIERESIIRKIKPITGQYLEASWISYRGAV